MSSSRESGIFLSPLGVGRLLVLVGPAGAGKTTLAHRLRAAAPERRAFSVSHTTRPRREAEVDGHDYWFVEREDFEHLRAEGGFVESAEVHGNCYGTSRAEIARLRAAGRDVLFDIDIQGAHHLWQQFPSKTRLCFVLPPSWRVLVERLQARGTETETTICRRLRTARLELEGLQRSPAPWHLFINDSLEPTVAALEAVLAEPPPPATDVLQNAAVQAFLASALADPRSA